MGDLGYTAGIRVWDTANAIERRGADEKTNVVAEPLMEGFLPASTRFGKVFAMVRVVAFSQRLSSLGLTALARSTRTCRALSCLFAFAFVGGACAEPRVSLASGPREYTESDYPQVLERWTRSKTLTSLSELDTLLTVTSTFESWDFRWAYVVRYANDYRLTVEQRRTLLEKTLAEGQDSHRFYVALYGTNMRWTDLTRPGTAWIVRLVDDEGNETAPLSIELVARPGPLERRYFPYTSVWRSVFRIKFPTTTSSGQATIAPDARWFGLRFAGAEGNEELRWDIGGAPSKSAAAFGPGTPEGIRLDAFLHAGKYFE